MSLLSSDLVPYWEQITFSVMCVSPSSTYKFFSKGVGQLSFSLGSYLTEIIRAPLSVVCWNSIYLFDIYICIYLAFGQHTNLVKYVMSQEDCKSRLTQIAEKWERTIHSVILSKVLVMQRITSILGSLKAKSFVSNKGDPILYHAYSERGSYDTVD